MGISGLESNPPITDQLVVCVTHSDEKRRACGLRRLTGRRLRSDADERGEIDSRGIP
jgi:hypothetical protein